MKSTLIFIGYLFLIMLLIGVFCGLFQNLDKKWFITIYLLIGVVMIVLILSFRVLEKLGI